MTIVKEVVLELDELRKLDVSVPRAAYRFAKEHADEYHENGMSVSEIADLCITLAL